MEIEVIYNHVLNTTDLLPGGRKKFLEWIAPMCKDKVFLTMEDVAERYKVSRNTILNWMTDGVITPTIRIKHSMIRFTLEDLDPIEKKKEVYDGQKNIS